MPDIEVTIAESSVFDITLESSSPVIDTTIAKPETVIDVDIQNLGAIIEADVHADSPVINVSITDANTEIYVELVGGGPGNGGSYIIGHGLKLDAETNTLSVDAANDVEKDNTRPITSAAVYTEIGNINSILASI